MLNISPAVVWVIALSQLMTFGLTVWNLVSSGSRANAKAIAHHDTVIADLDRRVDRVATRLENMPTSNAIHRLELQLTEAVGELKRLDERLKPVTAMATRAQEQLLHQAAQGR